MSMKQMGNWRNILEDSNVTEFNGLAVTLLKISKRITRAAMLWADCT